MLFTMPGTAATPSKNASFASLLAGLASPERAADWPGGELEDDVATISYEKALRAHTRTRAAEPLPDEAEAGPQPVADRPPAIDPRFTPSGRKPPVSVRISEWVPSGVAAPEPHTAPPAHTTALLASRKSASVTVRLTAEENEKLHERATAAGLTASAYLRSCLFETEILRTQVKEALEQFRTAADPAAKKPVQAAAEHSAQTRRSGLLSRWLGFDHIKSA